MLQVFFFNIQILQTDEIKPKKVYALSRFYGSWNFILFLLTNAHYNYRMYFYLLHVLLNFTYAPMLPTLRNQLVHLTTP